MTKQKSYIIGCVVVVLLVALAAGIAVVILSAKPESQPQDQPRATVQAPPSTGTAARELVLMTWNLRGYPEKDPAGRAWFTSTLAKLAPDVLCIQEIADRPKVDQFMATERRFTKCVFADSADGQDNAIFGDDAVEVRQLPAPTGFQHPAEAAYVTCGGFDATIITVHLSWTDKAKREREKKLLGEVVAGALKTDPDVLVCGDFNTERPDIDALAASVGLKVMIPANVTATGTTHAGHRYDWFMVSPDLESEEAIGCEVVTFTGPELETAKRASDHLPVKARFRTDDRFRDRR